MATVGQLIQRMLRREAREAAPEGFASRWQRGILPVAAVVIQVLTPAVTQSETGPLAPLDDFQCYTTKDSQGNVCRGGVLNEGALCTTEQDCGGVEDVTDFCVPQPFPKGLQVVLTDRFETGLFDVQKPLALCNPARMNAGGIADPDTHLESYRIKLASRRCALDAPQNAGEGCRAEIDCGGTAKLTTLCRLQPAHTPRTGLQIENEFHPSLGLLLVDTIKPDRLLVPTAKNFTAPVGPLNPDTHDVDHFKCYTVKAARGAPKFQPIRGVSVVDQFNQPRVVDLEKPTRVCLAVEKNGEPITDAAAELTCYRARLAATDPPQPRHVKVAGIFVANQFGPERIDTLKEGEFCVPSPRLGSNRDPVGDDDSVTTPQGSAVTIDVLLNDTDADGDVLTISEIGTVPSGTAAIVTGGILYTPPADFVGRVQFSYSVSDGRGGGASATVTVDVLAPDNVAPTVAAGNDLAVTLPAAAELAGNASDDGRPTPATLTTTWSMASGPGTVAFGNASAVATGATFSASGQYVLRLTASDGALSAFDELTVTVNPAIAGLPPDPVTVAPPLDPTLATTLGKGTQFLYTGANPIQTGVAPGTIDAKRAGVLRGRVLDRSNSALPGVTITILGHPEFGQTLSRADGVFDLAVNGGGLLTVKYDEDGVPAGCSGRSRCPGRTTRCCPTWC